MLAELHSERFVDQTPAAVYAALLDEGRYLCSERTMYRVLAGAHEVRERRNQLRHPHYAKPKLLATRPNELWSWDITKLLGPAKWTYFSLYVLLDIFSRYVVGWMVAPRVVFEALVYVLRTGCQWKALPKERFGSASAIHKRFLEWEAAGFFQRLLQAGLAEYDDMEGIAWRWQSVDGAMVKAPQAPAQLHNALLDMRRRTVPRTPGLAVSKLEAIQPFATRARYPKSYYTLRETNLSSHFTHAHACSNSVHHVTASQLER